MKIISALLLVFLLGCSNGGDGTNFAAISAESTNPAPAPSYETFTENSTASESNEVQEQKIIKTAQLSFETNDVATTHQHITQLAAQYKGLVQSDNSGKSYNRVFKNLVIRIPSENFQKFIDGISEGVAYFDQKDISRQDVSEEFVDLEARLKAKRELENRYLELLKKANSVKDMLDIEGELSNIREEIEAKQGRLQFLQNRVSLSTVTIEFYKTTAETGVTQSYGQKMKHAFQGGWNGISVFFLGLLYLWPLFLVAIIVIVVLRIYLRNRKKKH